jgi:hypothetical protein
MALSVRLRGEYREMPGLRLTVRQAARLFGLELDIAEAVLDQLRHERVLRLATDGAYSLVTEPSRWAAAGPADRTAPPPAAAPMVDGLPFW